MITFTPIHKRIQTTLYQKIDMLTKNKNLYSIGSNMTKPDSDGTLPEPNQNYMLARSTWTRATSFVPIDTDKPVILMGGELDAFGNLAGAFDSMDRSVYNGNQFESKYDARNDRGAKYQSGFWPDSEGNVSMPYRPMPGIKDISVEYRGGGMTLGATRTSEINWTCWTWEELDRLQQHFLAHGKTVFLEWGWTGSNNKLMLSNPYPLFEKDDNGLLKFNLKEIGADKDGKTLSQRIPEYILKQNGHYDAMLGVVQNFTWTVRDDGGFDCVTTLVSPGMNALQKQFKSSGNDNLSTLPLLVESMDGGDVYAGSDVQVVDGWDGITNVNELKLASIDEKSQFGNVSYKGTRNQSNKEIPNSHFRKFAPYINFKNYMADLPSQLESNWYNNKTTRESGTIIKIGQLTGLFGNNKVIYPGKYEYDNSGTKVSNSEFYCTWGWFEDNVLSRFFGNITIDGKVQGIFRSLDYKYDEVTGEIVKELKNEDGEVIDTAYPQSVKIRSTKKLYTVDTQKWLLIQDDVLSGKIRSNVHYKFQNYKKHGNIWRKSTIEPKVDPLAWRFSPKSDDTNSKAYKYGVCTEDEGFIRNVYFHGMYLANKMLDADTMESAIMSVWDEFAAAYGGVHQFKIEFEDDGNHIVIRDTGQQGDSVINLIENGKTNRRKVDGEPGDMNGLFEFPIWENGSIVKSQNLNAKLPSRMQMAAMYGSHNTDTSENDSQRTNDVLAGMAWGKLFSPDGEEEDEKTLAAMKKKKYKDMFSGNIDFPSKHNRSFGRADASPMTNLHVGDGDGTLKTPKGGTIVYPSIFDEIFAGQAQELQKRIKESLEGEDVKDDRSWYQKMFGASETTATENKMKDAKKRWKENFTKSGDSSLDMYIYDKVQTGDSGRHGTGKTEWGTIKIRPEFSAVMKSYFRGDVEGIANKTDPIIPVELEMDVDGTGGIFPGNAFQSSYLPQRYKDICCFQVVGASHKVDPTGWTTTVKGQIRVGMREKIAQKKKSLQMIESGEGFEPNTKLEMTAKDLPDAEPGMFWGTDANGKSILKPIPTDLIADPALTIEAQGSIEEGDSAEEILEMTKLQTKEVAVNVYGASDAGQTDRDQLLNQAVGIKPAFEVFGDGNHYDLDELRTLVEGIDMDMDFEGTGNQFLRYMSGNVMNPDLFPTSWNTSSASELQDAYNIWRTNYEYAIPLIGSMSVPEWLNVEGNGRWQTGGAGQGG